MSKVRESVEWLFKEVISKWSFLDFRASKKMEAEIAHTKQRDEAEKQRQEADAKVAQAMHTLLMKLADKI